MVLDTNRKLPGNWFCYAISSAIIRQWWWWCGMLFIRPGSLLVTSRKKSHTWFEICCNCWSDNWVSIKLIRAKLIILRIIAWSITKKFCKTNWKNYSKKWCILNWTSDEFLGLRRVHLTPKRVSALLNKDIRTLRYQINRIQHDLMLFNAIKQLKSWLKGYRILTSGFDHLF